MVAATRSVAYPVALAGAPEIAIGLIGSNPFPRGAVVVFVFGWTVLAVLATVARDASASSVRIWLSAPVMLSLAFFALLVWQVEGGVGAYGLNQSYATLKIELFVTGNLIVLVAGILIARHRGDFDLFVLLLLAVAALSALLLVKQLLSGQAIAEVGGRYSISPQENPIFLGRRSSDGIIIALFLLLTGDTGGKRMLGLAAIPFLSVALLASGSRGPVLGLIVGALVLLALVVRDAVTRRRLVGVAAVGVIAAVLAPELVPGGNISRSLSFIAGSGPGLSSNGRFELWGEAWHAFLQHPLLGIGTGGFARLEPVFLYPHNLFLEALSEHGVVGFAVIALLFGFGVHRLARARRRSAPDNRARAALVIALFASAFVNTLLSDSVELATTVWLCIGLGTGLALAARETVPDEAPAGVPARPAVGT